MALTTLCTVLLVLTTTAFPGLSAQTHAIITSQENPFDGGAVGSCEVPTTSFCVVDYPVPTSIARLAAIIEDSIMNEVESQESITCANAYKDVLCTLRFPRCQQLQEGTENTYSQVDLNNQDCSVLQTACPDNVVNALLTVCNSLSRTTSSATGCSPVSELVGDFTFNFCRFDSIQNILVTDWMFEYMKSVDRRSGGILYNDVHCGEDLATFMCTFGGECTEDESRIEFINTHEHCNSVQSCYGDDHEMFAERELSCHLWPQEHLRHPPEDLTPSSSSPLSSTTVEDIIIAQTTDDDASSDFVVDSGYTVRQSVACVLFLACLLVLVSL